MNLNSFEALLLILVFFLPGYFYFLIRAKFNFQSWENKEILFLGFLFNSLIFQLIALQLLRILHLDILDALASSSDSLTKFLINNFELVTYQIITGLTIALIFAILQSLRPAKLASRYIQQLLSISNILNFGLEYIPSLYGVIEQSTDFGRKFVGCVVELKDGRLYDGNIVHVGFNTKNKDHIIVLQRVTKSNSSGEQRKVLRDNLKVLIPYSNIQTITYTEYPVPKENQRGIFYLSPLNLSLGLVLLLLVGMIYLQEQLITTELLKSVIELFGSFVVTFLGVYISFLYAKKNEKEKEDRADQKIYLSSLKLLASELNLNKQPLSTLCEALENIPSDINQYYDNFGFLIEISRNIKFQVFYGLISSGGMEVVSRNDVLFNHTQQGYYNLSKALDGLYLTRDMLKEFKGSKQSDLPPEVIEVLEGIIVKEVSKLKGVLVLVSKAEEEIIRELNKHGISFIENLSAFPLA